MWKVIAREFQVLQCQPSTSSITLGKEVPIYQGVFDSLDAALAHVQSNYLLHPTEEIFFNALACVEKGRICHLVFNQEVCDYGYLKPEITSIDVIDMASRKLYGAASSSLYVHPNNPELSWSGRGRRPAWLNELLAMGHNLDGLRRREPVELPQVD